MQERSSEAFVIATANDVTALPPELLRKGRFDEMFFVDLPTRSERAAIATATLKTFGRDPAQIDVGAVADATAEFTGAEIAAIVPEAMFVAFNEEARPIETDDLILAAGGHHPGMLVVRFDSDPRHNLTHRGIASAINKLESSGVPIPDHIHVVNHWR